MSSGPPFLARLLLFVFLDGEEREVIGGDLEEEYRERVERRSERGVAARWYWRQALGAVSRRTWERIRRMGRAVAFQRAGGRGAPEPGWQVRKGARMREIGKDIRFGARTLGRRPVFTVVAGLTLALGVGANTAMFSVLNTVLLKPLDYPDADRIVQVWSWRSLSKSTLVEIGQEVSAFSSVSGYMNGRFALTGDGIAEEIPGAEVSPDHFAVMGVQPALGRGFRAEDSEPGRGDVVVLSDELWRTRYGASADIVGASITLDGKPHVVVGVMPAGYRPVGRGWRAWVPMTIDPTNFSDWEGTAGTTVLARLAAGATPARATAELKPIARAIQAEVPDVFDDVFVAQATATPLLDARVNGVRGTLWLLLGAVGLVLLIACANVANLLLAQGGSREREMAIRQSQGASGGRLIRQLLTESVLLGFLGGLLGLLLSISLLAVLHRQLEGSLPRGSDIGMDYRVLLFAAAVSFLTALLFGLVPALRTARTDVNRHLRDGSRRGAARPGHRGMNRVLVALEVATSLVLLAGAGLLLKSTWLLQHVDPGFRTENMLTVRLNLPGGRYAEPASRAAYFRQVEEQVGALPGVRDVGSITFLPMTGSNISTMYTIRDRPRPEGAPQPFAMAQLVTPGLLRTLDLPLLRGRWIEDSDTPETPLVGVINEAMAREAFGNDDPLGQEMQMFGSLSFTVVGVVGDMRQISPDRKPGSEAYFSFYQVPQMTSQSLAIGTSAESMASIDAVRDAIARVDADVPVSDVAPLDEIVRNAMGDTRLVTLLLSLFAGIALLLGMVGVYGIIAYTVSQRTWEIGVRKALGASSPAVVRNVVGGAAIPVVAGMALGLGASFAATRLLDSLLFEVEPADPVVLLVVTAALGLTAIFASVTPARRAAAIDPARCLNPD